MSLAQVSKYLIEEAYEAADAIGRGDPQAIRDELGDLLVQVLSAAVLAEQEGRFPVLTLMETAANKAVRRHPHVYAGSQAANAAEVVANWNQIKREERKAEGFHSALDGIAGGLPALMRAQKLGIRAREAGMDWADIHDVLAKVREEMADVLLYLIRLSDKIGVNLIDAAHNKIALNAQKYPVEKSRGNSRKYTEL